MQTSERWSGLETFSAKKVKIRLSCGSSSFGGCSRRHHQYGPAGSEQHQQLKEQCDRKDPSVCRVPSGHRGAVLCWVPGRLCQGRYGRATLGPDRVRGQALTGSCLCFHLTGSLKVIKMMQVNLNST